MVGGAKVVVGVLQVGLASKQSCYQELYVKAQGHKKIKAKGKGTKLFQGQLQGQA